MSYAERFENLAAPHSERVARYLGEDADDEIAALRAERDRAQQACEKLGTTIVVLRDHVESLETENERLRELLKEADIARRALLKQKP